MPVPLPPEAQLQQALGAPPGPPALPQTPGQTRPSLPNLFEQQLQAAQPAPVQPQGYQQAGGQALLQLLNQYLGAQGGFAPIAETARQGFKEEQLPQLLAGYRGGTSGREIVKQRAMERLERELAAAGGEYQLKSQGQLGQLLQGQQQIGLQQQQQALGGVQGVGGQIRNLGELLAGTPLEKLKTLLGGQKAQAQLGIGQGGDVALDSGNIGSATQIAAELVKLLTGR